LKATQKEKLNMTLLNKATILLTILVVSSTSSVSGFSVDISRRQAIQAVAGGLATAVAPSLVSILPANAVVDEETPRVTSRMGGNLVRYTWLGSSPYPHSMYEEDSLILPSSLFIFVLVCVHRNHSKMVFAVSK
jgi:hypothetical protein